MTFTLSAAMLQPIVALLAGIPNSLYSTNLEFRGRYLSHIRGRDGVMASPFIRPSALKSRWEATACLAPLQPRASSVVFDHQAAGAPRLGLRRERTRAEGRAL
jgi:hypothetical protein